MSARSPAPEDAIGTIVGLDAGCVLVRLETGDEVLCRGVVRLHRPLGFMTVPYGRRVRIRHVPGQRKRPWIVAVLDA